VSSGVKDGSKASSNAAAPVSSVKDGSKTGNKSGDAAPAAMTGVEYGLLVRFIIPNKPAATGAGTPLLFRFHGTGGCGLNTPAAQESCACSPDIPCSVADGCKDFQVAQEGVLVVKPAERGTIHCYDIDDPMTATATWLGRLEFEDVRLPASPLPEPQPSARCPHTPNS
jgi:hypothetical protein